MATSAHRHENCGCAKAEAQRTFSQTETEALHEVANVAMVLREVSSILKERGQEDLSIEVEKVMLSKKDFLLRNGLDLADTIPPDTYECRSNLEKTDYCVTSLWVYDNGGKPLYPRVSFSWGPCTELVLRFQAPSQTKAMEIAEFLIRSHRSGAL